MNADNAIFDWPVNVRGRWKKLGDCTKEDVRWLAKATRRESAQSPIDPNPAELKAAIRGAGYPPETEWYDIPGLPRLEIGRVARQSARRRAARATEAST